MLFDLRGRGRRRTIQAIYLTLAILMGGGLVFFGIGGDVQGGLFDAFRSNTTGGDNGFEKELKAAERRVRLAPRDAAAWARLADVRFRMAGVGENYDQTRNTFTRKGRAELARAGRAWERHLALDPKKPNSNVASLMVQAFGPNGLNQPDKAVGALEIVIEAQPPSSNLYAQLAILAYRAGQTRKGDLASDRAISLAPKDQRSALRAELKSAKSGSVGAAQATPSG